MSILKIPYQVAEDAAELARLGAEHLLAEIEAAVAARGRARIAVSGGSTPKAMFGLLASDEFRERVPWQQVELFWVDERTVGPEAADSNYRMTNEALLSRVPLPAGQVHRMEGELEPEAAAARYESLLRNTFRLEGAEVPRFDVVALGMGDDGHTASLFPHTAAIWELGRIVVANEVPQKQTWRLTLTWPVINQARSVFFLIGGADKAGVVREVFQGTKDVERLPSQLIWPASGILTVILEKAAAAQLPATDGAGRGQMERTR